MFGTSTSNNKQKKCDFRTACDRTDVRELRENKMHSRMLAEIIASQTYFSSTREYWNYKRTSLRIVMIISTPNGFIFESHSGCVLPLRHRWRKTHSFQIHSVQESLKLTSPLYLRHDQGRVSERPRGRRVNFLVGLLWDLVFISLANAASWCDSWLLTLHLMATMSFSKHTSSELGSPAVPIIIAHNVHLQSCLHC